MKLFPAIDLLDGCAVRLVRGDYEQKTVYSTDPAAVARSFREAGAEYLHMVDLDGARDGSTANLDTVAHVVRESGLRVELGGGIRSLETAARYRELGVWRVILGTAAVEQPTLVRDAVQELGEEHVAVGVDVRDGMVATRGWKTLSGRTAGEFCRELEDAGVRAVICTDISRDGMLGGPGTALYRELCRGSRLRFVASGGVSSLDDLLSLRALGKALYTGALDLREAIRKMEETV